MADIELGKAHTIELWLQSGASIDGIRWTLNSNPLLKAIVKQQAACVKKLLEMGANANYKEKRRPLLFYAVDWIFGSAEIIKLLLAHGAKATEECAMGGTALHLICRKQFEEKDIKEIALCLIKAGANMNAQDCDGETVLHRACSHQDPQINLIHLLVINGADPTIRSKKMISNDGSPYPWSEKLPEERAQHTDIRGSLYRYLAVSQTIKGASKTRSELLVVYGDQQTRFLALFHLLAHVPKELISLIVSYDIVVFNHDGSVDSTLL